ncbi:MULTISPECIES: sporulation protein [Streptomyces]|uniref:Sporulation protein n=1 Tax=Streptomyces koelreuteriae TaxID=2838015 RepID=A0ABX8FTX9_9ACTN|nr:MULTISPECIES: sporulation protein [Streptomyces]QWB24511.1 sporulation protein [Streptomyces koelreuteriae]UUA07516.1 sporulation protein [Streptomyces koelreuteriae]UUA15145.1 sporulation protein [Streptomyces sp. CRCS-T-1]
MSREPNAQLIAVMDEAKVSNKGLAKRMKDAAAQRGISLGTTHVSVQRWRDGAGIQPQTAALMADVLSAKLGRRIAPGDLGFFDHTRPATPEPLGYPSTVPDVLSMLDGLAQERADTVTSEQLIVSDSDLSSAVLSWMIARPDGIQTDKPAQQRVGMRDVRAIRDAAATFMQLDFKYGGGHGHKALRHYFRHEVLPLLSASYSEKVGTALFGAAAEVSQLLAWTAYDSGNHPLAHRYLTSTLRLSQVIDDRMFGARILGNLSHQANYLGNHAQAIQLARAAVEGAKGRATPRAMANYWAMEARALSNAGDLTGASLAMNQSERHFERADGAEDPLWLSYFDDAELLGEFCHCFRDLRMRREAVEHAQRAVDSTDPQYARTLGFCRMVLAQSQLLNGELEAAVTTASLAVDGGDSLQSSRFQRYVSDFRAEVSAYAANPAVVAFNEQVNEALARLDEDE